MKRLSPHDIIKNNSYVGYRRAAVISMAEHYGFVHTNEGKDGKHLVFINRDYNDLRFNLKTESGDVGWTYLENIVKVCMEVERRNAERKQPVFNEIPKELLKALPSGTRTIRDDHRVEFEHGAVVDLDAAEMPPVRHYMLEMRGNTLSIRSTDYPLEEFSASFNVKGGSANVGALKAMFETLDAQVLAHTHEVEERFNDDLRRLSKNHGYKIHEEQGDFGKPHWVMTHPIYGTQVNFLAPKKGQAISDEILAKLDILLETSRDEALAQMTYLEQLAEGGWTVVEHPANGAAPHMTFTHLTGQSFDMPVYGVNKIFDEAQAQAQVEAIENPLGAEKTKAPRTQASPSKAGLAEQVVDGRIVDRTILRVTPRSQ